MEGLENTLCLSGTKLLIHQPMSELLTFSRFHSQQEAQELISLLENRGIEFKIDFEKDLLDKIYTGESQDPMIAVKIPEERFEELNTILLSQAQTQLTDIDPNYYLFSFSDSELIEVLNNRNDWNHLDQALAHQLLSERKIAIPDLSKKSKDTKSYVPLHLESSWIIAQYLLTLLLPYVGIIIGLATLFAYKTLSSGKKMKMYNEPTRNHAKIMLALGIIRTLYFFFGAWFQNELSA